MLKLTKEELLGTQQVVSTPEPATSSGVPSFSLDTIVKVLEQVNALLSNPFVQGLLTRGIASKLGVQPQIAGKPSVPVEKNNGTTVKFNEEQVFIGIEQAIAGLKALAGDIKLSEVQEFLKSNKNLVIDLIKKGMGDLSADKSKRIEGS